MPVSAGHRRVSRRERQRAASRQSKSSSSSRSQARAGQYRSKQKVTRIITLLDELGAIRLIRKRGRLNVKTNPAALDALEKRAQRFMERNKTEDELDDELLKGALEQTDELHNLNLHKELTTDEQSEVQQLLEEKSVLLETLGVAPGQKAEGIVRLVYENVNGLQAKLGGNEKLDKMKTLLDDLEADVLAITEHKNNMKHRRNRRHGVAQLFNGGEVMARGKFACNGQEGQEKFLDKKSQEGGTGMVAFGELASLLGAGRIGMDETGLGRWTYMEFKGEEGISTVVVSGYVPCKNNRDESGTTYQQHRRYFAKKEKCNDEPRKRFLSDLTEQLKKWRDEDKKLVVCLDANENVYRDIIGRTLTDMEGLDMRESFLHCNGTKLGATHFRGSRPIDAVWTTKDLEVTNACAMPIGYGIGDHRMIVVDINKESMIGAHPQAIVRPGARRLNSKIPSCLKNYNKKLEELLDRHKLTEKMLESCLTKGDGMIQERMNRIDELAKDCMIHAEKKCRKLKSGNIPFSPEASLWIKRTQFYRSLLRFWSGKGRNRGNLKRAARRCKIRSPFKLSVEEVNARLTECKTQCRYFKVHGARYRKQHLNRRLTAARDKEDSDAERRILQIMQREKERAFWSRLNWSLGKKRGSSVGAVQMKDADGDTTEFRTQKAVQDVIWREVHQKRYHMAEEAPICQGKLRGEFGYSATSIAAKQVLAGTYEFDEDFHQGTKRLMEAITSIRDKVPIDSVDKIITREIWQQKWKKKKEETSSSVSTLHFGHYISGAHSDQISDFHALKTSLAIVHGIAFARWSKGLCVMLEKVMGVRLINKLRAILLMEADFNAANKIIYGERMMDNVRKYKMMPDEIFSERMREATDGGMSKKLFYDIVRQLRRPAGIASVDAANCYDRVAHAISSLVFQAFGAPEEACTSMHTAIQEMQFFLRTAFGDSKESVGARVELKTQGFMQGNGASPAGWAVVSIAIIQAHKEEGHGATFLCPITKLSHKLAGILYVDDTDITHLDLSQVQSVTGAHASLQASLDSWCQLLIATGGALKPEKCFYHLISFRWDRNGKWKYIANEKDSNLAISVQLPDGTCAPIDHLSVDEARITLGMSSCPSGKANEELVKEEKGAALSPLGLMKDKAMKWANQARTSKLSPRDIHFSIQRKMWPKIKYGLCANESTYDEMVTAMHKPYYLLCPLGGVIRSAKRELRYLDTGFYGVGFPHWGIESTVDSINRMLIHYGTQSIVGVQYQMSLELLTIELGLSPQLFQEDYSKYDRWATDCSIKQIWERVHRFGFQLTIGNLKMDPPRKRDKWFMKACEQAGFSRVECDKLQIIRQHQQVVYESDVFAADGRHLDPRYQQLRPRNAQWSTWLFAEQQFPASWIHLWRSALNQLAPSGRRQDSLGDFEATGHKIWEWQYCQATDTLQRTTNGGFQHVTFKKSGGHGRHSRYTAIEETAIRTYPLLCTVSELEDGSVKILSHNPRPPVKETPDCFLEVLQEWGCTWLWEEMRITNSEGQGVRIELEDEGEWIYTAIQEGTFVCVSDGSYVKEMCPHICSAAAILECKLGRGRIVLAFSEQNIAANAYRGELLGLLAIHLLLLSFNKARPELSGSVNIFSDCLGALHKVEHLPPGRIPTSCRHSDILKIIMTKCQGLSFRRFFSHVKAHVDEYLDWDEMKHEERLNSACDVAARTKVIDSSLQTQNAQKPLPLEPLTLFVGGQKMTTDTGDAIRYGAQLQEARTVFEERKVLSPDAFDEVAWRLVHKTLHDVPKMFQIFACKQVFSVSATFDYLYTRRDESCDCPICPFCTECNETAGHILRCPEEGRIKFLHRLADELLDWLDDEGAPRDLIYLIVAYIKGRGSTPMVELTSRVSPVYRAFAESQDNIGWRRFLEGMVSKQLILILTEVDFQDNKQVDVPKFICTLIKKLLEISHGLWIYRNLMVHDSLSGVFACERKEKLMEAIDDQLAMGEDGLREEDKWLLEVDLNDLDESTTGERETYWVLAVQAARERFRIMSRTREPSANSGNTFETGVS